MEEIKELPRIPKKEVKVKDPQLIDADDEANECISVDSGEAVTELSNFLQPTPDKRVDAVRPPVRENGVKAVTADDKEPANPFFEHPGSIARRHRSTSRPQPSAPQRRQSSLPRRVVGPPGVPVWDLWGSEQSAPGAGKKKHKKYNPRRHLELDDYEPQFLQNNEEPGARELAVAVPPVPEITQRMTSTSRVRWTSPSVADPEERVEATTSTPTQHSAREEAPTPSTEKHVITFGLHWAPKTGIPRDDEDAPVDGCFNCWSLSHARRHCPKPPSKYCGNCGRRGVTIETCVRCGPEYEQYQERERERKRDQRQRRRESQRESRPRGATGGRSNVVERRGRSKSAPRAVSHPPAPSQSSSSSIPLCPDVRNKERLTVPMTIYRQGRVEHYYPEGHPKAPATSTQSLPVDATTASTTATATTTAWTTTTATTTVTVTTTATIDTTISTTATTVTTAPRTTTTLMTAAPRSTSIVSPPPPSSAAPPPPPAQTVAPLPMTSAAPSTIAVAPQSPAAASVVEADGRSLQQPPPLAPPGSTTNCALIQATLGQLGGMTGEQKWAVLAAMGLVASLPSHQ